MYAITSANRARCVSRHMSAADIHVSDTVPQALPAQHFKRCFTPARITRTHCIHSVSQGDSLKQAGAYEYSVWRKLSTGTSTYSMQLSSSWQAASCLEPPKVHYHAQNSPLLVPILSQINPVRSAPSYLLKIYFNIIREITSYPF
jgi:hypothetical protein